MHDAKALQSRLNEFARAYSRAEIARKTETSVVNVSRYLKGTRVPAEFCMALVRQFGVNANWLLAGQGSLFVSDLATQHGQMAGDLLELVEAMSAVAKMRLGSIAGRDHMKLLRQLNDSLGTYERLREKLNQQSKGSLRTFFGSLTRRWQPWIWRAPGLCAKLRNRWQDSVTTTNWRDGCWAPRHTIPT